MVTYHFLGFFLGTLATNMKGFLGAYYDDVSIFVEPLDGKLGLSQKPWMFYIEVLPFLGRGLEWPFCWVFKNITFSGEHHLNARK